MFTSMGVFVSMYMSATMSVSMSMSFLCPRPCPCSCPFFKSALRVAHINGQLLGHGLETGMDMVADMEYG
jgi:hypothetical protein